MAFGAAITQRSRGENITHFGAIRMRVVGTGQLLMTLQSLDDVETEPLLPITLQATTNREITRLCNFSQQRSFLRLETININERVRINRIIVFVKEIYTSYPGTE